ncbi:MAG: DUF7144 family membrane protein [Gaiellaceae bacterium]
MTDPRTQAVRIQRDTGGMGARARSGWAAFAGLVLMLAGSFNVIFGLTAIFEDETLTAVGGRVIVWDLTAWGWIHLVLGLAQLLAAVGLFAGRGWARWAAIAFAMVNAIAQVGFITVYPLWTLLVITLDLIVIYQLSARWEPDEPA